MTEQENFINHLGEECGEVALRVSKAVRFGINEVWVDDKGRSMSNAERIQEEYADVVAVYETLIQAGLVKPPTQEQIAAKKEKMKKYLAYSYECGTISPVQPNGRGNQTSVPGAPGAAHQEK